MALGDDVAEAFRRLQRAQGGVPSKDILRRFIQGSPGPVQGYTFDLLKGITQPSAVTAASLPAIPQIMGATPGVTPVIKYATPAIPQIMGQLPQIPQAVAPVAQRIIAPGASRTIAASLPRIAPGAGLLSNPILGPAIPQIVPRIANPAMAGATLAPELGLEALGPAAPSFLQKLGYSLGGSGFARPSLFKSLGWGLAGLGAQMGTRMLWNDPNSGYDEALANAIGLGTTAAGIGSMVFPGVGTAIGALGGTLIGGLQGYFSGRNKGPKAANKEFTKQRAMIEDMLKQLPEEYRQQPLAEFDAAARQAKSPSEVKAVAQIAQQGLPAFQTQIFNEQRQQARALAIQAAMQSFAGDYLNDFQQSSRDYYANALQSANSLPSQLGDLYRQSAAKDKLLSDKFAAAIAAQIAYQPTQDMIDRQRNFQNQLEQAIISQQVGQAINPGAGTLEELLAQQ